MKKSLYALYREARRKAKLRRKPWEEWQQEQERLLIELLDPQCIPILENLRMAME